MGNPAFQVLLVCRENLGPVQLHAPLSLAHQANKDLLDHQAHVASQVYVVAWDFKDLKGKKVILGAQVTQGSLVLPAKMESREHAVALMGPLEIMGRLDQEEKRGKEETPVEVGGLDKLG